MVDIFWQILLANLLVSLAAFVGILALFIKKNLLEKVLPLLVALSAGTLMGAAFLHLIPEAVYESPKADIFSYVLIGFISFFLIEKLLHWRHCHQKECPIHTFAYLNLLGDGAHNFIDGLIIAASLMADFRLGWMTVLAILLHEIPQEIGDFGVLVYAGFKKEKALFFNFLTAITAILGGLAGYFLIGYVHFSTVFLIPFAAGGFIYISASDLIPEIRKETNRQKSWLALVVFILGVFMTRFLFNLPD